MLYNWITSTVICLMLVGCVGGSIQLSDGTKIRQPWNANTPATITEDGRTITTGADQPQTATEIRESARGKLVWIGAGLILCGVLVIGVLKYPTPGGLVIGAGILLLTLHQYPWIGWASIGLCAIGAGIYYGHEIGERKPIPK